MTEVPTEINSGENLPPPTRIVALGEKFILFPQAQIIPNAYNEIGAEGQLMLQLGNKQLLMELSLDYIPPKSSTRKIPSNFALVINPTTEALSQQGLLTPVKRRFISPFLISLRDMRFILEIPDVTGKTDTKVIEIEPSIQSPIERNIPAVDATAQKTITDATFAFGIGDGFRYEVNDKEALLILQNLARLKGTFAGKPHEEDE
jgi:hypothetical protein